MTAREQLVVAFARITDGGGSTPCLAAGGDLWLSESAKDRAAAARRCDGCPVLLECSWAAEEEGETFGVWGGRDRTGMPETTPQVSRPGSRPPVMVPERLLIRRNAASGGVTRRPLSPAGSSPAGMSSGASGACLIPDRRGGAA